MLSLKYKNKQASGKVFSTGKQASKIKKNWTSERLIYLISSFIINCNSREAKTTKPDGRSVLQEIIRQFGDRCGGNGGRFREKIRGNHKPTELAREACRLSAARRHLYFLKLCFCLITAISQCL